MLVRLTGADAASEVQVFEDVDSGDWYYDEVMTAYSMGLVKGIDEDTFKPNEYVTREQMAAMAARLLRYKYYYESESGNTDFADENQISSWAKKSVKTLNKLEIMQGKNEGMFDPKGLSTRLEAVVVLERLLTK